jgi:alpha-ketoglutarate-dependent taurine dioxygenase
MPLTFAKLGSHMAVAAEGIDLARPIAPADAAALRRALLENLVLCIRGQALKPALYREAMRLFGTLMLQTRSAAQHAEVPEIMILSSEDRDELGDGKRIVVGAAWHSDDSYKAVPCSLTILYGVEVQHLAGIEDALGVEHRLEAAHQLERDRVLHRRQEIALEHADAVLGRDRAAVFLHHGEDHGVHLVPALEKFGLVGADRLADVVVDIAVAEMAERHGARRE